MISKEAPARHGGNKAQPSPSRGCPLRLDCPVFRGTPDTIGTLLVAGCGKQNEPVAQAEKKEVAKGVPAPSVTETKAIAEEAFKPPGIVTAK